MKLFLFILIAILSSLSQKTAAQKITLTGTNLPLPTIVAAIEKQTGYVVVVGYRVYDKARPDSISASNQPLIDFLDAVLKGQPFGYTIRKKTIFIKEKDVNPV